MNDVVLPLALLAIQLVAGRALAAMLDEAVDVRERVLGLVAGAAVALALCLRRERPVAVLGVTVVVGAAAGAALPSSAGAPVLWVADLVALYSLVVHRPARIAVIGGAVAASVGCLVTVLTAGGPVEAAVTAVMQGAGYAVVIAFGRLRRRRVGLRRRLAARLGAAERERLLLAVAERERLARDLHDVAGHHLSAVTVHTGAALRLAERRPEMVAEALDVAVGMGREVLAALNRMVDMVGRPSDDLPDGDLRGLISPLCGGLARLGIPVSVTVAGHARPLPGETVAAAYGVVQESLTNAMRHAMGAPVTVRVEYRTGAVDVLVRNEKGEDWNDRAELGGGRGVEGMRRRAAKVGGSLRAGPTEDGGWSVHAALPAPNRSRRELGWNEVVDVAAVGMCVGPPLVAVTPPDPILRASPLGLACLIGLLSVHALVLWWRRKAPVATLAAVVGVDIVWVGLALSEVIDPSRLQAPALAWPTEAVAVYSLAVYGPSVAWGLWGAVAAGAAGGLLAMAGMAEQPFTAGNAVIGFVFFGALVTLCMLPLWAWGAVVRSRRHRDGEWERTMAEAVAVRTDHVVRAERYEVAVGLRGAVFDHTVRLVRTGESALRGGPADDRRAALAVVAAEARAALAGMRELLETLEARP
nr:histidine kinase [Thermomonospora umbrina]